MKEKVYPDTYELEPDIFGDIGASEEFRRAVDSAIGGTKSREVSSSKAAVDNSAVGGWGDKTEKRSMGWRRRWRREWR
jgi:hypothetical protein